MTDYQADREALNRIARTALEDWDIDIASVTFHFQSENTVFRVVDADGEAFALRVHRDGYHDLAELESEHAWTSALASAGLSVPQAVLTRDGQAYTTITLPGSDQTRHVGLVKWIPGTTLVEHLEKSPEGENVLFVYESLGQVIADFHRASSRWSPPPGDSNATPGMQKAWSAMPLSGDAFGRSRLHQMTSGQNCPPFGRDCWRSYRVYPGMRGFTA